MSQTNSFHEINKTKSNMASVRAASSNELSVTLVRPHSVSLFDSQKSKGLAERDSLYDVKDSLIRRSLSIVDGMKKFYRYSDSSLNYDSGKRVHNIPHDDIESFPNNHRPNSHDESAVVSLYIYNKLCNEMGFPKEMVKNILIYDKDQIGEDVEKAIDFCIKTEDGWKHTFIPEDKEKYSKSLNNIINN